MEDTIKIDRVMTDAYMEYAMAVNLGRAIPEIRDGLKPVQRRVIQGLLNLSTGKFVKSARVVGEVLGKYHPHGDSSVYDAAISMSRDWGARMPLIEPQGNNGSISGDSPAAMRYTEMRLSKRLSLSNEIIKTHDMPSGFTYDGETVEAYVLPIPFPLILINGARGIGVSVSTYIPPFNPKEVLKAVEYIFKRIDAKKPITSKKIASILKGPDFPTGGTVSSPNWERIIATGKGNITHEAEIYYSDKTITIRSVCTETTVTQLLNSIVKKADKLGIKNVTDLTTSEPEIKIVYKKEVTDINVQELYEETLCRVTKKVNIVATDNNSLVSPGVVEMLLTWIKYRVSDIIRNSHILLERYIDVKHKLELTTRIIPDINKIIEIIRHSDTPSEAARALVDFLDINIYDAEYILSLKLKSYNLLSIDDMKENLKEVEGKISLLNKLINNNKTRRDLIILDMKESFSKDIARRRTEVKEYVNTSVKDSLEYSVFLDTKSVSMVRREHNGKDDKGRNILKGSDTILILTSDGVAYRVGVDKLPTQPISPFNLISPRERNVKILFVAPYKPGYTFKVTLYNGSKEVVLPDNLIIGRGGNRLFNVNTKIKSVSLKKK